jgi:CrcB protein
VLFGGRRRATAVRDPRELAAIFAGGAIGTLLRALTGKALTPSPTGWPWATFLVNLVAAFLLGYVATRLLERLPVSNYRRPFLGTGVCGGLSTFSTMDVEIIRLAQHGAWLVTISYAAASLLGGLAALHVATMLVRRRAVLAWAR